MTLGISLSGGGIRGAAHIGILKALEDSGIHPQYVSGASAGSIIAGMYALGIPLNKIEEMAIKTGYGLIDPDFLGIINSLIKVPLGMPIMIDGIIKGEQLEKLLRKVTKKAKISETRIPLAISAVDINTSKIVMFVSSKKGLMNDSDYIYEDNISIADAIRASIAIPVIFKPKIINELRLVDGGVRENIPVDVLKRMGCTSIIAVNLGYSGQVRREIDNIVEIGSQTIDIMAYQITKFRTNNASIMLNPHIYNVNLFDFHKVQECIDRGYQTTIENIDCIKRAINRT